MKDDMNTLLLNQQIDRSVIRAIRGNTKPTPMARIAVQIGLSPLDMDSCVARLLEHDLIEVEGEGYRREIILTPKHRPSLLCQIFRR